MKNNLFALLFVGFLLLTQSCQNDPVNSAVTTDKIQLSENDSLFEVNDGGYKFSIVLPKDLMINATPDIVLNGATGELHITVGEQFWIVATQEKGDLNNFKSALADDMLFKHEVVEENSQSLLFKRVLPDGTEYDYSYKSCSDISGTPYVFRTSEEGEFTKDNVTRMKQAINTVRASV